MKRISLIVLLLSIYVVSWTELRFIVSSEAFNNPEADIKDFITFKQVNEEKIFTSIYAMREFAQELYSKQTIFAIKILKYEKEPEDITGVIKRLSEHALFLERKGAQDEKDD